MRTKSLANYSQIEKKSNHLSEDHFKIILLNNYYLNVMKISKSAPIINNHTNSKIKRIDDVSKGITRRLIEKYNPKRSLFSIEVVRDMQEQKGEA